MTATFRQPAEPAVPSDVDDVSLDSLIKRQRDVDDQLRHTGAPLRTVRLAPLLAIVGQPGARRIFVGCTQIAFDAGAQPRLRPSIACIWCEQGDGRGFLRVDGNADVHLGHLKAYLKPSEDLALTAPSADAEQEQLTAALASSLWEASVASIIDLRELRYELELRLTETSHSRAASVDHNDLLASLIQLNIICGRAQDQAREAERTDLSRWITSSGVDRAPGEPAAPQVPQDRGFRLAGPQPLTHAGEVGLRWCEEMCEQLDDEADSISALLTAAAGISNSKAAQAQERFNILASVASVGLGLPALVLTFYGTTSLLPLDLGRRGLAFLPVALSLVIALAMVWSPPLKKALGGIRTPLGGVALVFLVLLWAGLYPPSL